MGTGPTVAWHPVPQIVRSGSDSTGPVRTLRMRTQWIAPGHWSSDIPLDTPHIRLDVLAPHGYVQLRDAAPIPEAEYLGLEYMDWKSGGDTNFAPIATADGRLDCRGFWKEGDERTDKNGLWTSNAARCPSIVRWVESVGANFGRVRVIKLEPQDYDDVVAPDAPRRQQPVQPRGRGLGGSVLARAHRQSRTARWC